MKANVIIRMGAAHYDVRVRDAAGKLVCFDLRAMDKTGRRNFHREFMNAFRQTQQDQVAPVRRRARRAAA